MTYEEFERRAYEMGLVVLGGFHPDPGYEAETVPEGTGTILMLAPDEPDFWEIFVHGTEYADGEPDPLNRWSERVLGQLADLFGGTALYPFGGPPWAPFLSFAEAARNLHASPVGLAVHPDAGLWVSFRGALALPMRVDLPEERPSPCDTCAGQPCRTACPVDALTAHGYDVPACQAYVLSPEGEHCRTRGCAVRRACPVSQRWGRLDAQAAFHMEAFLR